MVWKGDKDKWRTNYSDRYRPQKIHKPSVKMPGISKSFLISSILIFVVCVLSFFNFKTGNYVGVLEKNITELQQCLNESNTEIEQLRSNVGSCDEDLESQITSLRICENEKKMTTSSLDSCTEELNSCYKDMNMKESQYDACQRQVTDLENTINRVRNQKENCEDDLDKCERDLTACQSQ